MGNLSNKFIVVTGASTGIGRAVAIALAKEGGNIALVARRVEELEKTKKIIVDAGGNAEIFPVNLSKVDLINQLVSDIKAMTNHVDIGRISKIFSAVFKRRDFSRRNFRFYTSFMFQR